MLKLNEKDYKTVVISNPLGADNSIMRPTLIHSMMESLRTNYNRRNKNVLLFEIANIYLMNNGPDKLPDEHKKLILGGYGDMDFFDIKGTLLMLFENLHISGVKFVSDETNPTFHPYRTADIYDSEGNLLGIVGEIHPAVCDNYEIGEKTYIAQLDMETLQNAITEEIKYKKLPKFPAVTRDLAMLVPESTTVGEIEDTIRANAGKLLEAINLFDVYQGKQIPEGKKSVAYSFALRAADHTLTDEEIQKCVDKIIEGLKKIKAELR